MVFSPDFETVPFGIEAAVAGKLVYRAGSFSDIDRKVDHICVPFNVVVVRKRPDGDETFDGRTPDQLIRSGGLTLLRFQNTGGLLKLRQSVIRGADTSVPFRIADVRKESRHGLF